MFKNLYKSLSLFVATLLLSTAVHADHHGMKKDIVDVAVENGSFTTLVVPIFPPEESASTVVRLFLSDCCSDRRGSSVCSGGTLSSAPHVRARPFYRSALVL